MSLYARLSTRRLLWLTLANTYFVQVYSASLTSSVPYSRSKGLTEQALAEVGYKDTIIFRPAVLSNTNRSETRVLESALV